MPYGLPEDQLARLLRVLRRDPGVRRIWLFGSRVLNCQRPGSDIDLCMEAPGYGLPELAALEDRIDALGLPWKVDLILSHEIDDPALLDHIRRVGMELSGGRPSSAKPDRVE